MWNGEYSEWLFVCFNLLVSFARSSSNDDDDVANDVNDWHCIRIFADQNVTHTHS